MAELKNCKACGRLYEKHGLYDVCSSCLLQDQVDFDRIREYLDIHPQAKIFEVSTNLNISVSKIKRFLREGRIEIIEKNNSFLKCEACGRPICSGNYCDECINRSPHDYKSFFRSSIYHKSESTTVKFRKNIGRAV